MYETWDEFHAKTDSPFFHSLALDSMMLLLGQNDLYHLAPIRNKWMIGKFGSRLMQEEEFALS